MSEVERHDSRMSRTERMTYFIDRRLNPKGKSLGQPPALPAAGARADPRGGAEIAEGFARVADIAKDRKIRISTKGTKEPRFRLDPKASGERDFVLPGNKEFMPGDEIKKPPKARAAAAARRPPTPAKARTISSSR